MNFGTTGVAAPKAASSRTARYSRTAWLAASGGNHGLAVAHAAQVLKVPAEIHIYEKGGHGFGLTAGNSLPGQVDWKARAIEWLHGRGWESGRPNHVDAGLDPARRAD